MKSNRNYLVDHPQIPLRLTRAPQAVDPSIVLAQGTLLGSIKLCISLAGFEAEKQVYSALDIDAGHWTRIARGEAHFPIDKLSALMDLCGNEAPLIWLVNARGYETTSLRRRESDLERELRETKDKLAKLEGDRAVELRLLKELRTQ